MTWVQALAERGGLMGFLSLCVVAAVAVKLVNSVTAALRTSLELLRPVELPESAHEDDEDVATWRPDEEPPRAPAADKAPEDGKGYDE